MTVIDDKAILMASTVRQWEVEGAEIDDQITELLTKRDLINRKLEAVRLILGAAAFSNAPQSPAFALGAGDDETMADAVVRVVREANRPLENTEIRHKLSEKPKFKESLEHNVNYYYTLIGRLHKRGLIDKVGRHIVLAQTNEAPTEQSESASKPENGGTANTDMFS